MIKTIDLEICPKYRIGDKIIYFSGPNKNESLKCEILDIAIEGIFYYDTKKDKVFVSDLTLYDKTYARYLLKVLESKNTPDGLPWMREVECLYPQISLIDNLSEKYD